MNPAELAAIFARIPLLRDFAVTDFTLTPLTGYTNHSIRIYNKEFDWVLRIPKSETGAWIDRDAEAHNQTLAGELGIAPQPAWRDTGGLSLTPTLAASRALTPADFSDPGRRERILTSLRRLHRSGLEFRGRVDLDQLLTRYFGLLASARQDRYRSRLRQAQATLRRLSGRDLPYVASHNDLVLENLLLGDDRLWLIDWEFSAMASPYWDLATLCNAARLSSVQAAEFLHSYCADAPGMEESTLCDYRCLLQLLSDCWMNAFVPETTQS